MLKYNQKQTNYSLSNKSFGSSTGQIQSSLKKKNRIVTSEPKIVKFDSPEPLVLNRDLILTSDQKIDEEQKFQLPTPFNPEEVYAQDSESIQLRDESIDNYLVKSYEEMQAVRAKKIAE